MTTDSDYMTRSDTIRIHTDEDFAGMRKAGRVAAECLDMLIPHVKPGVATSFLDDLARQFIFDHGGLPACVFYRGYQNTVCISANHVVCHGMPSEKTVREGDIVNIDVTCIIDGWHGDTSRMYEVGDVSPKAKRLIDVTYEAMALGLAQIKPGNTFGDIAAAIQKYAEGQRCSVVRDFCGHGVGRIFHDAPNVLHFGKAGTGPVLEKGMFFTVEPMINLGRHEVKVLNDGWTAVTRDKTLSAQCEHSCGVTDNGVELFTASPTGQFRPGAVAG
ncbi:type I methionyl aminopeptidase [Asticcacaulis sp. EMRT-3]|uniref:type I methionyl aminopeptidase n=1 Tax=Asticcacaulis sp. EMRT-3 TaxID=3040349 RepID=UPI0024AFCF0E|nr:type I methionyl aminopeptidase [Asticcacaulis sp. EMRT-3]MDI7774208.1 type I methionyl aminopeptidase [Asticcacaulis sp. EMRT-3]